MTPETQIILDESIIHDPPTQCQINTSKLPLLADVIEPVSANNATTISTFEQPPNIYDNPVPSSSGVGKTVTSTLDSEVEMTDLREDEDTDADNDYVNKCIICDDYGRDNELWYRCVLCGLWAHAECSGYDSPESYICDLCPKKG
ncbi:hypothetical protein ACJJTC_007886 [Scirpophaga incertulas]